MDGTPMIEERKRKLDGRVLRYPCEALDMTPERAILLYRTTHPVHLAGVPIPAGTLSYGVYWVDRPFNVYRWVDPQGAVLAYYFNVATETRIRADALEWLDLEVDVLVTPDGSVQVLDEDEVPGDLAPRYRAVLDEAVARLGNPARLLSEVEASLAALPRS